MANPNSKPPASSPVGPPQPPPIPLWAKPIITYCGYIAPFALWIALVLFLLPIILLVLGKTQFSWMSQVLSALGFFAALGYFALLAAKHDEFYPGWIGLVLGIAIHIGGPFGIAFLAAHAKSIDKEFLEQFFHTLLGLSMWWTVAAVIRLAIGYTLKAIDDYKSRQLRRQTHMDLSSKDAMKPSFIPKCWQMSRCRPGVRMTCPNFIDRHTCWKRRSGCFCDRELATYLMNSVAGAEVHEVDEMQRTTANALGAGGGRQRGLAAIRSHLSNVKRRAWKQQGALCMNCPLFIEHQEIKFQNLNWVGFPITLAIAAGVYPYYHIGYEAMAVALDGLMKHMAKTMANFPDTFKPDVSSSLAGSGFEYVLFAVLILLLLSYVFAFVERCLLVWRL
jgi:hypothetical protein